MNKMTRTTDAMMKAVIVQKKKEMLAAHIDALNKATSAGNSEIASVIAEMVAVSVIEVAAAEAMLRNPAA
jgi:hypothetical protein